MSVILYFTPTKKRYSFPFRALIFVVSFSCVRIYNFQTNIVKFNVFHFAHTVCILLINAKLGIMHMECCYLNYGCLLNSFCIHVMAWLAFRGRWFKELSVLILHQGIT